MTFMGAPMSTAVHRCNWQQEASKFRELPLPTPLSVSQTPQSEKVFSPQYFVFPYFWDAHIPSFFSLLLCISAANLLHSEYQTPSACSAVFYFWVLEKKGESLYLDVIFYFAFQLEKNHRSCVRSFKLCAPTHTQFSIQHILQRTTHVALVGLCRRVTKNTNVRPRQCVSNRLHHSVILLSGSLVNDGRTTCWQRDLWTESQGSE